MSQDILLKASIGWEHEGENGRESVRFGAALLRQDSGEYQVLVLGENEEAPSALYRTLPGAMQAWQTEVSDMLDVFARLSRPTGLEAEAGDIENLQLDFVCRPEGPFASYLRCWDKPDATPAERLRILLETPYLAVLARRGEEIVAIERELASRPRIRITSGFSAILLGQPDAPPPGKPEDCLAIIELADEHTRRSLIDWAAVDLALAART